MIYDIVWKFLQIWIDFEAKIKRFPFTYIIYDVEIFHSKLNIRYIWFWYWFKSSLENILRSFIMMRYN